jgi:NAD-dependent DNA ligase (contains BRCT domain type II)
VSARVVANLIDLLQRLKTREDVKGNAIRSLVWVYRTDMSRNPFNKTLDTSLRGKRARVETDTGTFVGWVERVHHSRGSVVLFDATDQDTGDDLGAVYVRTPDVVVALTPSKRIDYRRVDNLTPHPEYPGGVDPKDKVVRACRRDGYAGSFPVVRTDGTILNGHKRVLAASVAGLDHHPVEVVDVTDDQARELFKIAHRELVVDSDPDALAELTFTFTGGLSQSLSTVKTIVENHGGEVIETIDDSVDYLIAGDHPDDEQRAAAEQVGASTLDERALIALLDERGIDYPS